MKIKKTISNLLGGDQRAVDGFLLILKTELPLELAELKKAIEVKDLPSMQRSAHNMKNYAGYLGDDVLMALLNQVENLDSSELQSQQLLHRYKDIHSIITKKLRTI